MPKTKSKAGTRPRNHIEDPTADLTGDTLDKIETLRGDIQTQMLEKLVKAHFPKPWEQMPEGNQQAVINAARWLAEYLVRGAVYLAKADGTLPIEITIAEMGMTREKGIKLKAVMPASDENVLRVSRALEIPGFFIPLDVSQFMGERRPIVTDNVGSLAIPRTPKDADGKVIPHDAETGEVSPTERRARAGQVMPGEIGPVLP